MNSLPLVSICIPSYNHAKYLPYCLDSVLAQTYPNIEVIIVDDGSKDDSLAIAQSYADKHPDKISVYTHPNGENRGISNTVNYAFSLAKGKYWCGLCSDDAMYPEKTEKQVEFLEANDDFSFVYSYGDYIDLDSNILPGKFGKDITQDADPIETLLRGNVIPGMTVLAHREAMAQVGWHEPSLVFSDWDFWIRVFLLYKVGFISESLVKYRVHDSNTSIGIDPVLHHDHIYQVYLKLQKDTDEKTKRLREPVYRQIINENVSKKNWNLANAHLDSFFLANTAKDYSKAHESLKKAFEVCPRALLQYRRLLAVIKHLLLRLKK